MNRSRYYWQRLRTGPKQGVYRIQDRDLQLHVAECQFKENAELIVGALNAVVPYPKQVPTLKQETSNEQSSPNTYKSLDNIGDVSERLRD